MKRAGDFGWFILLGSDEMPHFELGILDVHHETIPPQLALSTAGVVLTFVVDDVRAHHGRALAMGADIVQEPTALPYGQTRLLLRDPAGTAVDISSPTAGLA